MREKTKKGRIDINLSIIDVPERKKKCKGNRCSQCIFHFNEYMRNASHAICKTWARQDL